MHRSWLWPGLRAGLITLSVAAGATVSAHAMVPSTTPLVLPPTLTVTNPQGQPVITPSQAVVITSVIWSLREEARSQKDPSWTATVETGSAAELDAQWMRGELASVAADEAPRTFGAITVAVPRQYRLPAFFIAHLESSDAYSEFLVFTRSDSAEPWRLALEAFTRDYDRERPVLPQPDADGFVALAQSPALATSDMPRLVAESWQHWAADGTPPPDSPIAATDVVRSRGHDLFSELGTDRRLGADDEIRLPDRIVPDGLWEIDYANGLGLVCFSMHYAEVRSGSWWRPVALRAARSGEPMAGPYLRITIPTLEQDCVSVDTSAAASGPSIALVADQINDEPRSTVAAPQPWLPIGAAGLLITGAVCVLILALRPGNRPVASARLVPLRQLGEDGLVRATAAMLARGLVLAQVMAVLLLEVPSSGLVLAVLVGAWLAWRLVWRRRFTVSASGVLPQSPDEIFAYVADLPKHKDWSTEIETVEALSDGPPSVGSRYRIRQRLGDNRRIEFITTVTDSRPGRRFATLIDEPSFRQTTEYTFRTVPTGTEVTSSIRMELGPLRALVGDDLRNAHVKQVTARRAEGLQRLRLILADPEHKAPPPSKLPGAVIKGPSLLKVSLVVTLLTILVTLNGWWPVTIGCWIAEGWCVVLCIHEFAHFFVARRLGNHPYLPVVTRVLEAAVQLRPWPPTGLEVARISAAGPLAVALAAALSLTLYGVYPWSGWLWWAVGASLVTAFGLLPLQDADGTKFLAPSARWFPALGIGFGAGVYGILVILGLPSVVLAAAAVTALGARLAPFIRAGPFWQSGALAARLILGLGWLAPFLYVALVAAVGLNWSIPLI